MEYYKTPSTMNDAIIEAIFNDMAENGYIQIFAEIWPDGESREYGYSVLYGPFNTVTDAIDIFDGNYNKNGCAEVCIGNENNHKCIYHEDREGYEGWYIPTLSEMNILVSVNNKYFISSRFINGYNIYDDDFRVRQYAAEICELFEDMLDVYGIDIPSKDRTGDHNEAHIYGEEYFELEKQVTKYLDKAFQYVRDHPLECKIKFNTDEY